MKKMYSIITISFFLLVLPSSVLAASAAKDVKEGNKLYQQEKYDKAAEKYSQAKEESPDSEIIHFNLGAALYKKGQYKEAVEATTKALSTEDRELEAKAVYNLANSTYKLGSQLAASDLNSAIGMYREALDYYKRAIELDGSDKEAKYNHELVERKLKVLLDQLKNQQQQQDHDQNREDGQDRQQSQADSDGQKEDEQQKNQQQKKQQHPKVGIQGPRFSNAHEGAQEGAQALILEAEPGNIRADGLHPAVKDHGIKVRPGHHVGHHSGHQHHQDRFQVALADSHQILVATS